MVRVSGSNDEEFQFFISQIEKNEMKSTDQLLEYLKSRFEVEEFPLAGISPSMLAAEKFNAIHSYGAILNSDTFIFHAYQILRTSSSASYFSEELTGYSPMEFPTQSPGKKDLLIFIFEDQTNHMWVNNSCLFCELITERGISQESVEKRDQFYLEYEFCRQQVSEYQKRMKSYNSHL